MKGKRKQYRPEFKAQVALAALQGDKTMAELAQEFGVHPTMINAWRRQLVDHAATAFERGKTQPEESVDVQALYQKIGQLDVGQRDKMNRMLARSASHLNTLLGGRSPVLFVINHASMSTIAPLACVHAGTLTIVLPMTLINRRGQDPQSHHRGNPGAGGAGQGLPERAGELR